MSALSAGQVRDLQRRIGEAVDAAVTDFKLSKSRATYDSETGRVSFRLEFEMLGAGGTSETATAEWKHYARLLHLPEDGIGRVFRSDGRVYTVTGIKVPRGRGAAKVIATTGERSYLFAIEPVRAMLAAEGD